MRPGERTVRLADGREVSNFSEEWRAECEAREVLGWPKAKRLEHYAECAKKRGKAAAERLRANVVRLYHATKGNP